MRAWEKIFGLSRRIHAIPQKPWFMISIVYLLLFEKVVGKQLYTPEYTKQHWGGCCFFPVIHTDVHAGEGGGISWEEMVPKCHNKWEKSLSEILRVLWLGYKWQFYRVLRRGWVREHWSCKPKLVPGFNSKCDCPALLCVISNTITKCATSETQTAGQPPHSTSKTVVAGSK